MNSTEKELIEKLRGFTTPELCDGMGLYRSMDYQIGPRAGREKIGCSSKLRVFT